MAHNRSRQKGYVFITAAVSAAALFGMAGLAFDVGRMYITKNEAQSYADAAAVSAALKIDGTSAGLTRADAAVAASTNKWNFGTTSFSGTVVEYSADGATGWAASGAANAATAAFARVTATVNNVALYFLPVIGTSTLTTVKASAIAGQQLKSAFATGVPGIFPFSPIAHAAGVTKEQVLASDPTGNFGFTVGEQYDLMWPVNAQVGNGNKSPCSGDNADAWVKKADGSNSERGYILAQGGAALRATILDQNADTTIALNQPVGFTHGQVNSTKDALNERIALDGDSTSTTYAAYAANPAATGERLVTVVVNDGWATTAGVELDPSQQGIAVGYAQFLLLTNYPKGGGANNAVCAIYVGNDPLYGSGNTGGGGNNGQGLSYVRLTQ